MTAELPIENSYKTVETAPSQILDILKSKLQPGEEIWVCTRTDLNLLRRFEIAWIIATETILYYIESPEASVPIVKQWAWNTIERLEVRDLNGAFQLRGHGHGECHSIAYYSKARIEAIQPALQSLRHLQAKAHPGIEGPWRVFGASRKHRSLLCETCGRPIPRAMGMCFHCIEKGKLLHRLFLRLKGYTLPLCVSLSLMLLITGIEMAQPVLTKVLIDDVFPNKNMGLFAIVVATLFGIHLAGSLFWGIRIYIMGWLGEKIVLDLRSDLYKHLQKLSLDFYDEKETGWIMDRITADTGSLQSFLGDSLQEILRDAMAIVVIITIMLTMNPTLALVALLPTPLIIWLTFRTSKKLHSVYHMIGRRRSRISSLLSGVIPGVRVVKAFAQEEKETNRFLDRSKLYMDANLQASRIHALYHPSLNFATAMGIVLTWAIGGYLALTGTDITLGTVIAFIAFLWRFYGPINNLSRMSNKVQQALAATQRVFEVFDRKPGVVEVKESAGPIQNGRVEFKNVGFAYEAGMPVLKNVSFVAEPGEMIGLVGPSGAGQSTTINLLCRFYDTHEGSIEIGGIDIRNLKLEELRSQIGVVLQETFLFPGSIAQNIAYGKPGASREELIYCARLANAHDFIMRMPDAYDTWVGERGQKLSGGERQRIAIARAILKNPRILILDEATSSVDTETEALIREALDRLVKGRTTFAIAHRFSTLINANRLVVLERGSIAEIGTHAELMAKEDGVFRRLSAIQTEISRIVAV